MYTLYFASCTISCEVNIHFPSSQHHYCLPPLPPCPPTQVITTHSRLYCRAQTGGGSVSGLLLTRRRRRHRRRASTGTAGSPRCGGSVAGSRIVAAPSPGSRLLPARRRCRQAPTSGGSVSGLIPAATRSHVQTAPTPVGKVTTPLACPYGTNASGQSHHPVACSLGTDALGPCQPSITSQCPEKLAWCFHS
jgi:hypothetical protein